VERVIDIGYEKVVDCQKALNLNQMTQADMVFLTSYARVMKPVERAMKLLEGETDCYLGNLIPTIVSLQKKLQLDNDMAMKPLTTALLAGLKNRFETVLNDRDYQMATMLHPKFKLNYFPIDQRVELRQALMSYVLQVQNELTLTPVSAGGTGISDTATTTSANVIENDDFYCISNESDANIVTTLLIKCLAISQVRVKLSADLLLILL
jgi:hypothetical protein